MRAVYLARIPRLVSSQSGSQAHHLSTRRGKPLGERIVNPPEYESILVDFILSDCSKN